MKRTSVTYSLLFLLLTGLIGFLGIHYIAPYGITQPPRVKASLSPDQLGLTGEKFSLATTDPIFLEGYWIDSRQPTTKGVLILLHGIGGCKEHFLGLSKALANQGIASIVVDGRAHGKSGGTFCTYGHKEKQDISQLIDWIQQKEPDLPIGIWGNSLGGAIALQTLAVEKRLSFGIIESTFTSLDQIVFDYKKRILKGFGYKPLSDYVLRRAGQIADFAPFSIQPIESVKKIEQPVLIAHGDSDKSISVEYGKTLFYHLLTTDKELVIVKGGAHYGLFKTGGAAYKEQVFGFIDRQF